MGLLRWLGIEKYLKKVKAYVDAQDKKIQENFKPSATSDWDAQQGESGYIKNKPFGDSITTKLDIPADFDPDMGEPLVVQLPSFSMGIYVKYPMCNPLSGDVYGYDVLNAVQGEGKATIAHPAGDVYISVAVDSEGVPNLICTNINLDNAYLLEHVTYKEYDEAEVTSTIKRVSPMYLPDDLFRTTPQQLTTEEKRVALNNLGVYDMYEIHPYIIDPHIRVLPSEFLDYINSPYLANMIIAEFQSPEGLLFWVRPTVMVDRGSNQTFLICHASYQGQEYNTVYVIDFYGHVRVE